MTSSEPPRIFCAIDTPDIDRALRLAAILAPVSGSLKLGLEFFNAQGPRGVCAITAAHPDLPLFLDLKYHDIPNTVAQAVRAIVPLRPAYINVHAAGGAAMMKAAVEAARDEAAKRGVPPPRILAVTVLTSLAAVDMAQIGVAGNVEDQVLRLTGLALDSGMDGVVCSAHEISSIRARFGAGPVLMVPGIRPAGHAKGSDDQSRVMTPAEAIRAGATHLVIGRPITGAPDLAQALRDILADL
jgi:orotidine-5'-phosphate decarboxylase